MCKIVKKLVSRLPRRALSNIDILSHTRDIPYFRGVYMRDTLPSKPKKIECAIVNLDLSVNDGTHWVAYVKVNNYTNYFDSYGLKPPKEILTYLTKKNNVFYNYQNCQGSNLYNCGHLCIKFLKKIWKPFITSD